jgi:site-specific DNA recombinase
MPANYLAIFDKGKALALYHAKRLASPARRIVLYANRCQTHALRWSQVGTHEADTHQEGNAMKTAGIYTRISLDQTGEGAGVARQLEQCEALAEQLGLDVVARLDDNDISAYSGKRRPGFEELLRLMQSGAIKVVICWHVDRLTRSLKDLERIIDAAEAGGVEIKTVNAGDLDLSNSSGRMLARILGSVARAESEHKGERQKLANTKRAEAGRWQTCNRTFGYTLDGQPLEPEASAVRKAVADVLAGKSINAITKEWNEAGLRTTLAGQERKGFTDKNGRTIKAGTVDGKWNSPRVRRLLINPRYAGLRVHRGKVVGQGDWMPLIDPATHEGLVAFLSNPNRQRTVKSFERKYLGVSVYLCGKCNDGTTVITAQPGGQNPGGRRYQCRAHAHLTRVGQPIDAIVVATIIEPMSQPDASSLLASTGVDLSELSVRREALQRKLDGLVEQFDADAIDAAQFGEASKRTRAKLADIDRQLAEATRTSPAAALVAAGADAMACWEGMSVQQRAQAVEELLTVTILPAPRGSGKFNRDYVRVQFKREEEGADEAA